jgi:branched-chain amino acid transport system permease protein
VTGMLLGLLAAVAVAALFGRAGRAHQRCVLPAAHLGPRHGRLGRLLSLDSVTGAENGIRGVDRPELIASPNTFYYFVLFSVAISALLIWRLVHSPFGMALRGIKESPSRMRTLGYNVPLTLTIAFTLSGFFAGVAGILFVLLNNFISPNNVALSQSVSGLLMVVLGGVGTLWGAFVGSAVMISLENLVSAYTERWPTILGLMFIFTMLFASEGLVGKAKLIVQKRLAKPFLKSCLAQFPLLVYAGLSPPACFTGYSFAEAVYSETRDDVSRSPSAPIDATISTPQQTQRQRLSGDPEERRS